MAQQSKGARRAQTVRFPDEHLALYKREADAAGLPLGDYLALVAARAHGLPEPAYIADMRARRVRQTGQGVLQLGA